MTRYDTVNQNWVFHLEIVLERQDLFVFYCDAIQVSTPTKYASIYSDKGRPHKKRRYCDLKKAPSSNDTKLCYDYCRIWSSDITNMYGYLEKSQVNGH